ncbi:MAG: hypothetical protein R2784_13035 [Saprospiraceae bacterium]
MVLASRVDTVVMAANIIVALQQVVSRFANPTTPSVLTLGKINSIRRTTNVIPNEVKIRAPSEPWMKNGALRPSDRINHCRKHRKRNGRNGRF